MAMVQYYNNGDHNSTSLGAYANEIMQFVQTYSDLMSAARDYGNGIPIKTVEIYTLYMIEQNPGITVSALAEKQRRTKGTISTNVTTLEKSGYIYREKRDDNAKVVHLYTTPAGQRLSTLYNAYTLRQARIDQDKLLKTCSQEDINAFCRVLHQYLKVISAYGNRK